jgi:hypothetical protein
MWLAWERTGKCTLFWQESPNERDHLENQGVDGRMGSEWILGRVARGYRVYVFDSGYGPMAVSCKCGVEPAGSGSTDLV